MESWGARERGRGKRRFQFLVQATGSRRVCGNVCPHPMQFGSQLREPIYTTPTRYEPRLREGCLS
eukprot:8851674-Pyramimonas_sp.AAC.1